jgi:hypothetical protein
MRWDVLMLACVPSELRELIWFPPMVPSRVPIRIAAKSQLVSRYPGARSKDQAGQEMLGIRELSACGVMDGQESQYSE